MTILLDIDGVLATTPSWKHPELLADGFMKMNENALKNLSILHKKTNASIVLTTTHRINYDLDQWKAIFSTRGLDFETISKINDKTEISQLPDRGTEIKEWVDREGIHLNYIILDDDLSIHALPPSIQECWVATRPLLGFDKAALEQALLIFSTFE